MRLARMAISSLYKQDIKAMGRKLLASDVSSFLWMRMVVAFFHSAGTSFASKQWRKMRERISPFGSRSRKWRYSKRSLPGAEFDIDRSLVEISSGEGAANKVLSVSAEGTKDDNSSRSRAESQERGPKLWVKYAVASLRVPS